MQLYFPAIYVYAIFFYRTTREIPEMENNRPFYLFIYFLSLGVNGAIWAIDEPPPPPIHNSTVFSSYV